MNDNRRTGPIGRGVYHVVRWLVKTVYPRVTIEGAENLPEGPCVVVGNHSQMNGPIVGELYFPGDRAIWCAGQMMHLKDVPAYAYQDFWSEKPQYIRWFYKLLSYVIAPLSVCVFNNAHTIPVYHDTRIITTFRQSVAAMKEGTRVIIFPEHAQKHNNIVNDFQDRFVTVAKLYYKRTGQVLPFVPMYLAPKLHTAYLGKPVMFDPAAPDEAERRRICGYLMDEITAMATALPRHTVVPYSNISKKLYPMNEMTQK